MLAGRTSTDSLRTSDSNRSQNPRMLTRQYRWQHPRANLLIQLETRPGKINPTGCSLLSYTQARLPTSSRPNPILPLQLEPWVLYEIHGYQPELESNPVQLRVPLSLQYKQQETTVIQEEVKKN